MKIFGTICAVAIVVSASGAAAAPQVLGLVASNGTPLSCNGVECSADVSAFCLQQTRAMPVRGTPYRPADGAELTLVAKTPGGELRLPGRDYLSFTSYRGFTAVRVSVPQRVLAELGATELAVEIGPRLSLLPVPEASDPEPQSAEEIDVATGPMRQAADRFFAAYDPPAEAARLANLLINALPEQGRSALDRAGADDRLWQDTIDAESLAGASAAGLDLAKGLYRNCRDDVAVGIAYSLRRCLEGGHDRLIVDTNLRFWDSTGGY